MHVIHGSPDPGLATFSIAIDDGAPVVRDLAAGAASDAIEVTPGTHTIHLLGVASIETGEAPEVMVTSVEVASGSHPIWLVAGEPAAEPPLAVTVLDESQAAGTQARIVHGIEGAGALDVCVGGTSIAAGLAPGAMSSYAPIAEGAVAIDLRAGSDQPCHGRSMGIAHVTIEPSHAYVIVLSAHTARRGRLNGNVVACTEGASVTCTSAAIGTR